MLCELGVLNIKNTGKIFEDDFKKSVPDYCKATRLKDPPQSFTQRSDTKYSHKNPYDFEIFDTVRRILIPLELKSTKSKSFSVELEKPVDDKKSSGKMVKYHQIEGLTKAAKYEYVLAGFLFNFRNENDGTQITYYQYIQDFNQMMAEIDKQSFNESDLQNYNAIEVPGCKKRVHYTWDMDNLLVKLEDYFEIEF